MYQYVGVVRNRDGLETAQNEIRDIRKQAETDLKIVPGRIFNYDQIHAFELFNMLELGEAVIKSALLREESRGAHYRTDYPETNHKQWLKNIITRRVAGELQMRTEEVKTPYIDAPDEASHE